MRIIAGELKGRRLAVPKGEEIRPTTDRVREAIFSALESVCELEDTRVLDLFAGTGSLGMEAISRGAKEAIFVEMSKDAAEGIRQNCEKFGIHSRSQVILSDVAKMLTKDRPALRSQGAFDIVFADPPYELPLTFKLGGLLAKSNMVRKGTVFVLESSRRSDLSGLSTFPGPLSLSLLKEKEYGETKVSFYIFEEQD